MPVTPLGRGGALLGLAAVLAVTPWTDAVGAEPDTLEVSARHRVLYDSNLFRSPTNARSETITASSVGLRLDKSYSLQRFELDADLIHRSYRNVEYLGFTALDYQAAWHWAATPRVRGVLSAEQETRSNSYADVSNITQRNLRKDRVYRLEGEANLGAAVRLIGDVGLSEQTNEQVVVQDRDQRSRSVMGGVRYVFPSGNQVSYGMRVSRGDYLTRDANSTALLPSEFEQIQQEIIARWTLTGKTSLQGRLAYVKRTHSNSPERDFSAPFGELRMRWQPTGKVRLDAGIERYFRVTQTEYASYSIGRRLMLVPSWDPTAHTSVRLQLEHNEQDYEGALPTSSFSTDRHDTTRLARLSFDWKPRQSILLSVLLQTEHRSSSYTNFSYKTNGAGLSARVQF